MRVLMICNTYMQVIISLQMKLKLYPDDEADIIISDHSIGADKVAEGLGKTGLFSRVKYVENYRADYNTNRTEKLREIFRLFGGDSKYYGMLWDENTIYDEICYYNTLRLVWAAFSKSVRDSKREGREKIPVCNVFEEGIFCYDMVLSQILSMRKQFWKHRTVSLMHLFSVLSGRKDILGRSSNFICFHPEIIDHAEEYKRAGFSFTKLPPLKPDENFLRILNTVFSYDPSGVKFPQKYIYFATSTDIDGNSVGETELVLRLADIVGRENLLVKMHPRDRRTVYRDNGLTVMENSSVPWEVMQLNHDFSSHAFVSLSSGSVVNIMAMTGESIPSYFLYPMTKGRNKWLDHYSDGISSSLKKLQAAGLCRSIKAVNTLEEAAGND
ncbi:MAG: hypothetical protein II954_08595 [Synergistaceae bacterium]|nr:hypothetical protein [Synergistaceae bacterium]